MFGEFDIYTFAKTAVLAIVPFMFAVTIHEYMHGYVAYKLGDNTAKDAGRLTLNPIAHIDPLGLIVLLVTRLFGWAKPVPVNYANISHKYGVAIVSAAGPLANLATAFLSMVLLKLFLMFYMYLPESSYEPVYLMIQLSVGINIALFVFNLLPIMPMDGARIIWNFLPQEQADRYEETEKYYFLIILVLILTNALSYIIYPIKSFIIGIFSSILGVMG